MEEARIIMDNAARMPGYHGTTTKEVVNKILDTCGGQIICNGELLEFVFTPIADRFQFKTEDWYAKTYGKG